MFKHMQLCLFLLTIDCVVCNQAVQEPRDLSDLALRRVADMANLEEFKAILAPILVPRVAGTPGNEAVRKHIISRLETLPGWNIESHSFTDKTPYGSKDFTNIIATHNINATRRMVLACHHDSKYFAPRSDGGVFVGATDAAVPCAMLIHLAENLHSYIASRSLDFPELTIQLLFFDGNEAFIRWTDTDSLYGSRYLAEFMQRTPIGTQTKISEIDAIDVLVLLDLIGARNPTFQSFFRSSDDLFSRMQRLESKLEELNKLDYTSIRYFGNSPSFGGIEDDHIPFLRRGVKILHLIPVPFPAHWHELSDNESYLDYPTIMDLQKIVQAFVAEYMHLDV